MGGNAELSKVKQQALLLLHTKVWSLRSHRKITEITVAASGLPRVSRSTGASSFLLISYQYSLFHPEGGVSSLSSRGTTALNLIQPKQA